MSDRLEYQVALQKDGIFDTYASASLFVDPMTTPLRRLRRGPIRSTARRKTLGFRWS
jgi:hypothetical protein